VSKHLLVGSTRASSGKSATVLGLGIHLQAMGMTVGYAKPLGTFATRTVPESSMSLDADVEFITQTLNLEPCLVRPTLLNLDKSSIQKRLLHQNISDYSRKLTEYLANTAGQLVLVEAPGNPEEGAMFGLSLPEIAECLDAPILLVARFEDLLVADRLLVAKSRLGDRLLGVVINDIPEIQIESAIEILMPFLESLNIPVFAMMPENLILRSVSVEELVTQLEATVLYQPDINLSKIMVQDLKIGAMDVNSAQQYFSKSFHKAVVTGTNRIDIQLAALGTSTNCLILTGNPLHLNPDVLERASEFEVPILTVSKDTLTTVGIIERCLGQVRLHEGVKVDCIQEMMAKHFNFDRLLKLLDISS
jgi:uncharacterized protein